MHKSVSVYVVGGFCTLNLLGFFFSVCVCACVWLAGGGMGRIELIICECKAKGSWVYLGLVISDCLAKIKNPLVIEGITDL